MMFSESLKPQLQLLLTASKGANPDRSASDAIDAMEVETVSLVQVALRGQGVELTYGEALDLWESVNLDSNQGWVDVKGTDGVFIELQRLCEHIRDGCDFTGITNPAALSQTEYLHYADKAVVDDFGDFVPIDF